MAQPASSSADASSAAFYDLATIRRLSGQIALVSTAAGPCSAVVTTPDERQLEASATSFAYDRPILLLPGAYNPPTSAHLALARVSLEALPSACCFFSLSTSTINKEQTERAILVDRLLLLDQIAQRIGGQGVLLTNRGLYVEQAAAARAAFPEASDLFFVVGGDKIEQIFDARYYQDRDAALRELFSRAKLLAAPRAGQQADGIMALLLRPENQPFRAAIRLLPLAQEYREVASSQVRAMLQAPPSVLNAAGLAHLLPPEALAFCLETRCYSPAEQLSEGEVVDRYALRTALIARALSLPPCEQARLDLQRIFALATSASERGRLLRRWLADAPTAGSTFDLFALPAEPC